MKTMMVIVMLALSAIVSSVTDLEFAYINNTFYYSLNKHFYGRGFQVLYGLLGILNRHQIPDLIASVGHLTDDLMWEKHNFGFWNDTGVDYILPEFDFWGHPDFRAPPYQYMFEALQVGLPIYTERLNMCFWSGSIRQRGYLRGMYLNCPSPKTRLQYHLVKEMELTAGKLTNISVKSLQFDFRLHRQYQFYIYLFGTSWSSSLKRIASLGGVLLMPDKDPYESFVSLKLKECVNCVMYYSLNATNFCPSVEAAMVNKTVQEFETMAKNLNDFMRRSFSFEQVYKYMAETFTKFSADQRKNPINYTVTNGELHVGGKVFKQLTCKQLIAMHKETFDIKKGWQLDYWYNPDNCDFDEEKLKYINYVSI